MGETPATDAILAASAVNAIDTARASFAIGALLTFVTIEAIRAVVTIAATGHRDAIHIAGAPVVSRAVQASFAIGRVETEKAIS